MTSRIDELLPGQDVFHTVHSEKLLDYFANTKLKKLVQSVVI